VVALAAAGTFYFWRQHQESRRIEEEMQRGREQYHLHKLPSDAIVTFQGVLKLDPDHWEAHYQLGLCYLNLSRVKEALGHLEEAREAAPEENQAAVYLQLGHAYRRRYEGGAEEPDFRRALTHYRQSREDSRFEAEALLSLGALYLGKNKLDLVNALEVFEEFVRKYPDHERGAETEAVVEMLRSKVAGGP